MTVTPQVQPPSQGAVRALLAGTAPRAASFIVTIYGDVVEPRGGTLAMATLIDTCARHGISESLVRTAVSRLVGAGRLVGERIGRRSFYRLSDPAQAEFRQASRIIFAPPPQPQGWLVALVQAGASAPPGWVTLGPNVMITPQGDGAAPLPAGAVMAAQGIAGLDALPGVAAQHWPLAEVARSYRAFADRFARHAARGLAEVLADEDALALRLRLIDEYRHAALADPRLPRDALGPDWPGDRARDIFRRIYLDLSPGADRFVGRSFADATGLLPQATPETERRAAAMRGDP